VLLLHLPDGRDAVVVERAIGDREKLVTSAEVLQEILHRYENYGLGDAILAREPFTGIAKVKFETYIQDHADQLADQKIKP